MNTTIIFIIILIILLFFIYKKKKEEKELFTTSSTQYNDLLMKNISEKFNLHYQGTRTILELCKYFYDENKLILPLDVIINNQIISDNFTVEGSCSLNDYNEVENLIVNGNITIDKKYRNGQFSYDENRTLDILPSGTIIPWMKDKIPKGWEICGDISVYYNSDDNNLRIEPVSEYYNQDTGYNVTLPNLFKNTFMYSGGIYIYGTDDNNKVGIINNNNFINIKKEHMPKHNHKLGMNYTETNKLPFKSGYTMNVDNIILGGNDRYIYSTETGYDEIPFGINITRVKVIYIMKL